MASLIEDILVPAGIVVSKLPRIKDMTTQRSIRQAFASY
jgi:hypothetical protein